LIDEVGPCLDPRTSLLEKIMEGCLTPQEARSQQIGRGRVPDWAISGSAARPVPMVPPDYSSWSWWTQACMDEGYWDTALRDCVGLQNAVTPAACYPPTFSARTSARLLYSYRNPPIDKDLDDLIASAWSILSNSLTEVKWVACLVDRLSPEYPEFGSRYGNSLNACLEDYITGRIQLEIKIQPIRPSRPWASFSAHLNRVQIGLRHAA